MKDKSINSILVFVTNQVKRLESIVDTTQFNDSEKTFEKSSENREAILDEITGILAAVEDIQEIFERDEELVNMETAISEDV